MSLDSASISKAMYVDEALHGSNALWAVLRDTGGYITSRMAVGARAVFALTNAGRVGDNEHHAQGRTATA